MNCCWNCEQELTHPIKPFSDNPMQHFCCVECSWDYYEDRE